jgi:hypothetical protein
VFNTTFSNISAISWRSVLVVDEAVKIRHQIGGLNIEYNIEI